MGRRRRWGREFGTFLQHIFINSREAVPLSPHFNHCLCLHVRAKWLIHTLHWSTAPTLAIDAMLKKQRPTSSQTTFLNHIMRIFYSPIMVDDSVKYILL